MAKRQKTGNHQFSQVPQAKIPRSSFNRSHTLKTTFDADSLIPIFVDEVLPGDTFNLKMTLFGRLATPIKPILDDLFLETFFFFVPYRLVWDNWQKFNGEQTDPGDSIDFVIPILSGAAVTAESSLRDYMGLPLGHDEAGPTPVSALPFRAYGMIWNEWFRDQNLQDSITVSTADGPDSTTDVLTKDRGKRHDYFTSCLPWPQKGDPVTVGLGGMATVISTGERVKLSGSDGGAGPGDFATLLADNHVLVPGQGGAGTNLWFGDATGLETDLSTATAISINDLRQAFQIQKLLERDARGGTRYTEIIRAHFGVVSPDARLQRPEFLGGGSSRINISPVAQTTGASDIETPDTPQGNLAAFGTVSGSGHGFTKSFTEHGIIIGLANVRATLTYQQGLNRMWSRSTRYDFYWPALSHIGEQAVLNKEIFLNNTSTDEDVFGYQERYAEYRYKPSMISGEFRSDAAASLDVWHLSEDFSALPSLNAAFIKSQVPLARCIAVPTEPHILLDAFFDLRCARPMPLYGVPGLIDHF